MSHSDPIAQFEEWYRRARRPGLRRIFSRPDAMTLATADGGGRPSARVVLFKGIKDGGFVFYTNYASQKGRELSENPRAALVFHWPWRWGAPERQVRIEGTVRKTTPEESAAYWRTRPRGSSLSAVASAQSSVIPSREALEREVADLGRLNQGTEIPRPDHWGGYVVVPETIEFWEARLDRLHERTRYVREPGGWRTERLAP